LAGGELARVGEGGSGLSGGQRARVALARAVYQDKSVYLLDDVLAAVDAGVARALLHRCLLGMLRFKTRILATHNPTILAHAHTIVVLKNGKIMKSGNKYHCIATVK
jgi:ATP-binding cassette, subfamily C (CFTR/MRP), member 10